VGAIGLLVHRLGAPGDLVVGQASRTLPFSGRRFLPAASVLWPPFGRAERYGAGVLRVVRREAPDLIEVHNRPNLARMLAHRHPQAKIMLFLHNDPQGMREARRPEERAGLLRRMTVICVSEHLRRRFMEGVRADRSPHVLPNAVEWTELPPALPRGQRERLILFAGRVVANKGADAFVRACAAVLPGLPGWRAGIIGADRFWPNAATTPFERTLYPRAEEAGIARLGYLPHAEVLAAMGRAAIVVVPSRWEEPFGMAALEAMACGAALVCSRRGGLPDVAGEAARYADPDEPGALEAELLGLCRDQAARTALAEAGTARARQFDAPAARARLAALRRQVLHLA
jgi:glycosyltransferase involved in cell wall biosynthesis